MTNEQIRNEMEQVQAELQSALEIMMKEIGKKLKPKEKAEIEKEIAELIELLERIKSGMIWICLFGKTSVGKSAVANSIIGEDLASVDIAFDHTVSCSGYRKDPWMIVDVPGIMGNPTYEAMAVTEAKQAHGHIFMVDGEPYQNEIALFDMIHSACPETPKIVFCNKADMLKHQTKKNQEHIRNVVIEKMGKYVKDPKDIIFGNAQILDQSQDEMIRQDVPELIERLYESAGTLGMLMNVLDPAKKAGKISDAIREKIYQVRLKIARRVAGIFAAIEVGMAAVPLSTVISTPVLLSSMVFILMKIMGKEITKEVSRKIALEGLKTCSTVLAGDFVFVAGANLIIDSVNILGPVGSLIAATINVAGLGYWRYKRTVIFAEVMIEFAKRDFSWGEGDKSEIIKECKKRAIDYHSKFRKNNGHG